MRQKNLSSLLRVLFICAFAFVISLGNNLFAKRNFTFDDAMKFESLRSPVVSNNGKWFAYEAKQDYGFDLPEQLSAQSVAELSYKHFLCVFF